MKVPHLTPVKSSNLQSVGYDHRGLFVRFQGGTTYHYADVPKSVFEELVKADSPGRTFQSLIRGKYVHRQVDA